MPVELKLLTNSSIGAAKACMRRYELSYVLGLRPLDDGEARSAGTLFHSAVEARAHGGVDAGYAVIHASERPEYERARVDAMFTGHVWYWENQPLEEVATELAFRIPLLNPETGAASRTFVLAGKLDRIVRLPDGRLAIGEYKTTGEDVSSGGDWWRRLRRDLQSSIYWMAARVMGYEVEAIVYDVTRRPAHRPTQVPLLDDQGMKIVLDAGGQRVMNAKGGKPRQTASEKDGWVLQTRPETVDEYRERVLGVMTGEPDKYFTRGELARTAAELESASYDVWWYAQQLGDAYRLGRWPRNSAMCHGCDFDPICDGEALDTHTPAGFVRLTDVHPELGRAALPAQQPPAAG